MNDQKFYISLCRHQFFVKMAGLMLILSYSGNALQLRAQEQDTAIAKDTVRQDSIHNRDTEENTYTPLERFLPPSPQAAALARYGEYPVSLATGVPEISIPLYEIKLGDYTLPISISYHASGIKVDDVASTVGLGWVLNAGGAVSRTVCGAPDFKNLNLLNDTLYRTASRFESLFNSPDAENYASTIMPILTGRFTESSYDIASDRYSYNFGTKAGVFRYSHRDQSFKVLNHQPIKIEYPNYSSEGYFIITDTDGIVYVFDQKEYSWVGEDDSHSPTSWFLTEIQTPEGNISLTYEPAMGYVTHHWGESYSVGKHYYYDPDTQTDAYVYRGVSNKSSYYYHHDIVLLKRIEWRGNKIEFNYNNDRNDIGTWRLTEINVKGCDNQVFKTITLNNTVYLGYSEDNYRMMLSSISISDEGTYSFVYNSKRLPNYNSSSHRDYWGYYNTDSTYIYQVPREAAREAHRRFSQQIQHPLYSEQYANKMPNLAFAKAGILEKINYPTGGYTQFSYELNLNGETGGLRVASIDDNGNISTARRRRVFSYTGHATQDSPKAALVYKTYHGYGSVYGVTLFTEKATCSSESLLPLCDGNGSTVFYDRVTETDEDGNETRYHFTYGGILSTHYDYSNENWPQLCPASLDDEGTIAPLLDHKEYYEGGCLVRKEIYEYQENKLDTFDIGTKILNTLTCSSIDGDYVEPDLLAYKNTNVIIPIRQMTGYVKTFSLMSKTVTDYKQNAGSPPEILISKTESFTYDTAGNVKFRTLLPKTILITNSDGKEFKTVNEYPFECADNICVGMYNQNMADQVVASRQYVNNDLIKLDSTLFVNQNSNWYYPYKQFEQRAGGSLYETLQLTDYDDHGNPCTIIENQTDKTALIWGFNSSYPVAKIIGKTYQELASSSSTANKIGQIKTTTSPSTMTTRLTELRNLLPSDVLTTTYNYKPLFGVSTITAENDYTTYYDYGTDGKLSAIRDNSGSLQQFAYQYSRPYNGSNDGTNFVQTTDMLNSTTGKITRQYYDGLGRPIETAKNIAGNYVYTMQTYDQKGRVSQEWLPAPDGTSHAYLNSIADISSSFYNDNHSCSITTYDALDRPTFIQTPGDAWHSAGKGITKEYITNAANSVKRYSAALDGSSLIKNGYYAASTLYAEKTTDEDGKTMTVFTDKRGRKVLERRGASNDTYYTYDDLDQLRFVLSPQYQESGYKDTYGYEYRYDEKGRLVKKILPQTEYTQYWYDTAGRMKFMQNATLRSKSPSLYRFYLYDKFGRLCIQGTCTSCWRGEAVNTVTYNTSGYGFQNTGYTLGRSSDISGTIALEVVNYYDNYDFVRLCNSAVSVTPSTTTSGLQTGLIRKASDGSTLTDAIYYDYKGRPTQTRSIQLGSRLTTATTSYKYWGDVYQTVQTDYPGTSTVVTPTLTTTTTYNYNDATGLLSSTTLSIKRGSATAVQKTIRSNTYDGLGRVVTNTRNGSSSMAVSYGYNLHNWVTEINGPGFHEWLYYADAPNSGTACYNGNISVQKWQASNDSQNRGYKFTYDALSRLSEAVYGANNFGTHQNRYNEKVVEYSANGMMKRFQRRGLKSDGIYGKVDNLHITLDGNRPVKIIEDAGNQTVYGAMEFQSHSSAETQYGYDGNGSLVWDANKQIAHITYDNLNYPKEVQFTNGNRIQYVYSPDGRKLRATWQTAVANIVVPLNSTTNLSNSQISSTTRTDYIGNVIYTGTSSSSSASVSLSKYLFEGGYATVTPSTQPVFHYYTQDHLGNNRAVVNQSGTVEQITHYYPFGGFFADQGTGSSLQPYKYNGKELDRMHGLDLYDYGFRQYDPVVPMFTQQDPMAEKYYHLSPYVYCGNNPVNAVDPTGKEILIQYKNSQGQFQTYHFNGFGGKSISIPKNQFVRDVITAYLYNASNGEINNMIKAATNPDIKIYIRDASDTDVMDVPSTRYLLDAGKHIITWQSRKGVKTTTGGRQSAATGLEHEFDHALNAIEDPAHNMRKRTYNEQYDTEEEKRVIEGSETKMARSHGESIRKNHKGETFDAVSPISLEELK